MTLDIYDQGKYLSQIGDQDKVLKDNSCIFAKPGFVLKQSLLAREIILEKAA